MCLLSKPIKAQKLRGEFVNCAGVLWESRSSLCLVSKLDQGDISRFAGDSLSKRIIQVIGKFIDSWKKTFEAGPQGPVFRWFRWVVIPIALLVGLTVVARMGNFDLEAQKAIYRAGQNSWEFGERSLWWFLYEFGYYPATIICFAAFIGFVLGLFIEGWKRWRKCMLYIVLLGAVGPGIITNLILKEYWGRPRPRQIEGLGGSHPFEQVLFFDGGDGKSFPCGHATMGYFFVGGFFLLRRYRRDWAWFFLIFGLCLGFFMGVGRMCQGGHYFSDVIWSGAITYFVAMCLYYGLRLHRGIYSKQLSSSPLWMKIGVPVVGAAMMIGVLLATPFSDSRDHQLPAEFAALPQMDVNLSFKAGDIIIKGGDSFSITGDAYGHGVPTSDLVDQFFVRAVANRAVVQYRERISGRFSEVNQNLTIVIPWAKLRQLRLNLENCQVLLEGFDIPADKRSMTVIVQGGDKDSGLNLQSLPSNFGWIQASDQKRFGPDRGEVGAGKPMIDIDDSYSGRVIWD